MRQAQRCSWRAPRSSGNVPICFPSEFTISEHIYAYAHTAVNIRALTAVSSEQGTRWCAGAILNTRTTRRKTQVDTHHKRKETQI
eukprot:scaffold12002_cov115-Isochrysis_galbana.AAC.3